MMVKISMRVMSFFSLVYCAASSSLKLLTVTLETSMSGFCSETHFFTKSVMSFIFAPGTVLM